MTARPARVGVVGCGNISRIYLQNARERFSALEVAACADLEPAKARARGEEFGVPACTPDELLADPAIEIVLNLTTPGAHAEVALAAVEAGKSVYNEKPLAVTREEGRRILKAAERRGVLVGCAPDTFMGAGLQTCRKLVDDGAIGRPTAFSANMLCHGHESWHPDPAFYYRAGGGPMLDMGPYYLTALVSVLGAVRRVAGLTGAAFDERTITSEPKRGQTVPVEVPTHLIGLLGFASGVRGSITTSFDVWAAHGAVIEVYGTEGSLALPDPNGFGGTPRLWTVATGEWRDVPHSHAHAENCRGIGAADMADALRSGRPHRASGELAFHVLDVMRAVHESSDEGRYVELGSACERPAPMPPEGLAT
jgi:predicted dehydrogenase